MQLGNSESVSPLWRNAAASSGSRDGRTDRYVDAASRSNVLLAFRACLMSSFYIQTASKSQQHDKWLESDALPRRRRWVHSWSDTANWEACELNCPRSKLWNSKKCLQAPPGSVQGRSVLFHPEQQLPQNCLTESDIYLLFHFLYVGQAQLQKKTTRKHKEYY